MVLSTRALTKVYGGAGLLRKEREVAELQGKITSQVNEKVSDQQREFFLREQLKIIQKELGISKDDRTSDVEMFEQRIAGLHRGAHAASKLRARAEALEGIRAGIDNMKAEFGIK